MARYTVFAGVNGAGKSTIYRTLDYFKDECRVNCDEILREFGGDWKSAEDQFKSGKIALQRIDEYFEAGISFNQETTLASKNAIRNAVKARDLGYYTELHYVYVDSDDIAIKRIENRVKDGGHGIPDSVVRQRYIKSLQNLARAIEVFDAVFIYDNTFKFESVATFYRGSCVCKNNEIPEGLKRIIS